MLSSPRINTFAQYCTDKAEGILAGESISTLGTFNFSVQIFEMNINVSILVLF